MSFKSNQLVETDRFVFFWKPPVVFGQWTRSNFEVDSVVYTHAEQFMMAEKARLFGDELMLRKIMASTDPSEQKKLGQAVRGFDEGVWVEQRIGIVVRGNHAKFSQSEKRLNSLLATDEKTLVEASPYDRIWGIGLRPDDPLAEQPSRWRGMNLLGQALMTVRDQLRLT